MSDPLYITCECGYELKIAQRDLGKTLECINCGADVEVNEASVHQDRAIHEPGLGTQMDTALEYIPSEEPHSPFEPTAAAPSTSSPSNLEYTPEPEPAIEPVASKPEPDSDWKPDIDRPSSPFEDPDEVIEEPSEPQPDPSLIREYTDAEHKMNYIGAEEEEEKCPLCGNPYRGDWDKQVTKAGEMCYICSNQATESIPDRVRDRPDDVPDLLDQRPNMRVKFPEETSSTFWLFDPQSENFRRMLWILAFGTVLLTVFLVMVDDYRSPFERGASIESSQSINGEIIEEESVPQLPGWARVLYWSWQAAAAIATIFITLYLTLFLLGRLPHETLTLNLIQIGWPTLLLTLMGAGVGGFIYMFRDDTFFVLYMIMMNVVVGLTIIIMLHNILDFGFRAFFLAFVLMGVSQSLVQIASGFFFWGLVSIAL